MQVPQDDSWEINQLAEDYVRLALTIGQYDEAFVDAYYGPDSLKPTVSPASVFPKETLLRAVDSLSSRLKTLPQADGDTIPHERAVWMIEQLKAFDRRVRIFSGEYGTFDEESKDLFGTTAPQYDEAHFQALIARLDSVLPGTGTTSERFQNLANRFIIPKNKLDTVFQAAIAESRKRTLEHYQLPETENFELEFVTNKSWNGYNWYKGNYQSLIQINTDLDIFIDRAIDVGSHESYPGHHVYNMLLEKTLYRDQGFVEISVYPLYSPQSLIAEGTANYGIDVVFPGNEKTTFAREVLLPLAGLDTVGIDLYFKALAIKEQLNFIRNEVGRQLLSGEMTEDIALQWLQNYGLYNAATAAKSISFIKTYRTYVINYNYGLDLVRKYIESRGGTESNPEKRWEIFRQLLSEQVLIEELIGV
jgi:hypothetical protein